VVIPLADAPALLPMPSAAVIVLQQTPNAVFAAEEFFKATLVASTRARLTAASQL
jgi:hypothetical protein